MYVYVLQYGEVYVISDEKQWKRAHAAISSRVSSQELQVSVRPEMTSGRLTHWRDRMKIRKGMYCDITQK